LIFIQSEKILGFGLWMMKVAVRQPVFPTFGRENAELLSVISRLPYFKSTKVLSQPLVKLKQNQ